MVEKNGYQPRKVFRRYATLLLAMLLIPYFSACKKDNPKPKEPPVISAKNGIANITIRAGTTTFTPQLQSDGKTWNFLVALDFDRELLETATISFLIPQRATSNPASGAAVDLTAPVNITVTAEDQSVATYTIAKIDGTSSDAAFTSFRITVGEEEFTGVIDDQSSKVTFPVSFPYSMTELLAEAVPTFEVSLGAIVSPLSGVAQDFTSPVEYTITAHDNTSRTWTVELVIEPASAEADFISFKLTIGEEEYTGIINRQNRKVTFPVTFQYSEALTRAVPVFEVSYGATVSPLSGVAQDFTSPVAYTITAQDQSTRQWTVEVDMMTIDDALNVKDFGAKGDGISDDTESIQNAIDEAASKGEGKIFVPDGVYMIRADDPTSPDWGALYDKGGIALKDNIHLILSSSATLKAFPSSRQQYNILRMFAKNNVTIEGGTIEGERNEHNGTTGEWGYGIAVHASKNVIIKNIIAKDCWGDGINLKNLNVSADAGTPPEEYLPVNVTVENVRCLNNRRQGMSIEGGLNVRISGSEFSFTNGTGPGAGIDIEPAQNHHYVRNLRIENCLFQENASSGVMVLYQATDGVEISGCTFINNKDSEAQFKTHDKCKNVTIRKCRFERQNGVGCRNGILFQNAENLVATENTMVNSIFVLRTISNGTLKNVTISQNTVTLKIPYYGFASSGNIDGITVVGNTFDFSNPEATQVETIELNGQNLVFSDNTLLAVDQGISVSNAPNAKIENNAIHGSSRTAGQIVNSPNTVFNNNVISGAGHTSGGVSFSILAGSDNTRITNNQFYQTSQIPVSGTNKSPRALSIASTLTGIVLEGNSTYPAEGSSYPLQ